MERNAVFEHLEAVALRPMTVGVRAAKDRCHCLIEIAAGDRRA
jgi:hypothetical protein